MSRSSQTNQPFSTPEESGESRDLENDSRISWDLRKLVHMSLSADGFLVKRLPRSQLRSYEFGTTYIRPTERDSRPDNPVRPMLYALIYRILTNIKATLKHLVSQSKASNISSAKKELILDKAAMYRRFERMALRLFGLSPKVGLQGKLDGHKIPKFDEVLAGGVYQDQEQGNMQQRAQMYADFIRSDEFRFFYWPMFTAINVSVTLTNLSFGAEKRLGIVGLVATRRWHWTLLRHADYQEIYDIRENIPLTAVTCRRCDDGVRSQSFLPTDRRPGVCRFRRDATQADNPQCSDQTATNDSVLLNPREYFSRSRKRIRVSGYCFDDRDNSTATGFENCDKLQTDHWYNEVQRTLRAELTYRNLRNRVVEIELVSVFDRVDKMSNSAADKWKTSAGRLNLGKRLLISEMIEIQAKRGRPQNNSQTEDFMFTHIIIEDAGIFANNQKFAKELGFFKILPRQRDDDGAKLEPLLDLQERNAASVKKALDDRLRDSDFWCCRRSAQNGSAASKPGAYNDQEPFISEKTLQSIKVRNQKLFNNFQSTAKICRSTRETKQGNTQRAELQSEAGVTPCW